MAKILLLDDNEQIIYATQLVLESAGHEVLSGRSGKLITQRIMLERPDILITDLFMPDEDGLGVINAVRRVDKGLPIIVISGGNLASLDYLVIAKDFGANASLRKPFKANELLKLIDDLLSAQLASG